MRTLSNIIIVVSPILGTSPGASVVHNNSCQHSVPATAVLSVLFLVFADRNYSRLPFRIPHKADGILVIAVLHVSAIWRRKVIVIRFMFILYTISTIVAVIFIGFAISLFFRKSCIFPLLFLPD